MLTITYTNKHTRKSRKINLNRLFCSLLILTLIISCIGLYIDFVRFPDKYITTWKYQLENEIASGDQKAIDYSIMWMFAKTKSKREYEENISKQ